VNNPYEPPRVPQEKDEIKVNDLYKEFIVWSLLITALFFLSNSIRSVIMTIVKNIAFVIRYVIELNS